MKKHIGENLTDKAVGLFAVAVAALSLVLRFVGLEADPPTMLQRLGHSLVTDPYYYTWFARNLILFDSWTPFDYDRYEIFGYTLVNGMACVVFLVAGVSRATAHVAALVLTLSGLALFVAAHWRVVARRQICLLIVLLSTNVFLFFYSRYPLMESGLLFWTGLCTFVYFRHGERPIGQFLCGAIVILAALTGKLFGGMLAAPLVMAILMRDANRRLRSLAMVAAGAVVAFLLYLLVFWGGSLAGLLDYLAEVRATVDTERSGSVVDSILGVLTYWVNRALIPFHSVQVFIGLCGLLLLVFSSKEQWRRQNGLFTFHVVWLIAATVVFGLPEWRPARHMLFALPPLLLLGAVALDRAIGADFEETSRTTWWRWLVALPITAVLVAIPIVQFTDSGSTAEIFTGRLAVIVLLALAVLAGLYYLVQGRAVSRAMRLAPWAALALVLLMLIQSGFYIFDGLTPLRYDIKKLNRDLAQLLPANTVLAGPNGPALTIDNQLGGVLEFFGPRPPARDLFDRYPITHVAIAPPRWSWLTAHTTVDRQSPVIFNKLLRGSRVQLRRIMPIGQAATPFDSLINAFYTGDTSRATALVNRLIATYPDNLVLRQFRVKVRYASRDLAGTLAAIEQLSEQHPGNLDVQWDCALMAARCYRVSRDPRILDRTRQYLERYNSLDAPETIDLDRLFEVTRPSGE
ncbi:hypothetical protein GF420_03730 [candidate division GN15 bacterium]|nr:hypothetical protein [candidate division GN15 bacterium]